MCITICAFKRICFLCQIFTPLQGIRDMRNKTTSDQKKDKYIWMMEMSQIVCC